MTKPSLLYEDKLPPKLPVIISDDIKNEIEIIKEYNQFEKDGLLKLDSYVKWITNHISNRAIVFDYGNRYTMDSHGTIIIKPIGVCLFLEKDSEKVYVRIIWIDLKLEEFGLQEPPTLYENKQRNTNIRKTICLKESELKHIVRECVRNILYENHHRTYKKYTK